MEYKSGFICPVCHFVASDGPELATHFEVEHESSGPPKHKAQHGELSHLNMAVRSSKPPEFGYQTECKVCRVAFGYSRTRHHCRNCGSAACGPHSRNTMALPHIGYSVPVRVCDHCFDLVMMDRQGTTSTSTQGIVKSGKLLKGTVEVRARLTHLSLSLFRLSEGAWNIVFCLCQLAPKD